jgi:heme/copper-type cytochrome/quinol oxidase subunit 3
VTPATLTHTQPAGNTLPAAPRRARRAAGGNPPGRPPGDHGGGGGGGGGNEGEPAASGSREGVGPFALALTLTGITTLFLVLIGVAVERAARRAHGGTAGRRKALRWLGASLVLGLAFLAAQTSLWLGLAHAGFVPASGGYAAVFFALTGLHALHVLGGLGFLAVLALELARPRASMPGVRLGAIYWHYMGALWLVLFALLYFVR